MYENLTYEMILKRMLDRVPTNVDKREGSVIWDALAPAAFELKLLYIGLDYILTESFADTASREFLIRRCAERGIFPAPATHAVLTGWFVPTYLDVSGKRFSMPNEAINYVVKQKIADGLYRVECESAGEVGHQYLGNIIPIDYIAGLEKAELIAVSIPGEEEQSTESLREMYMNSFSVRGFGGNKESYILETNAIDGVGATKVTPVWNGGGTVKLTILGFDFNIANPILINKVQQEIDPTQDHTGLGIAPIGHVVTVDTPTEVAITITTDLTFESGYSWQMVQADVENQIKNYLLELRKIWANSDSLTVRISQIEARILSIAGIADISNTTINGSTENLTIGNYEIPIFGSVTI